MGMCNEPMTILVACQMKRIYQKKKMVDTSNVGFNFNRAQWYLFSNQPRKDEVGPRE
jgi:hypothetical protein